ncbi:hypothetical protein E9529_10525 [Blastococcus sp. KM273128]|uniref:hypothetical protein n=1 Tax=Blastococcus sp. KM273128 TaxID=2570314 RepID=UPI001F3948F7|nr:hypothetical protein [Blastococcus sp. KM273128]MCF6744708.1 hypothetical protein [Blastococcus sp. KM273128]
MTAALDEPAVAAAPERHEHLRDGLVRHAEAVIGTVAAGQCHETARAELVDFLRGELIEHTRVEDELLLGAGGTGRTALLVAAVQDQHRMVGVLAREVERATDPLDLAVAAGALVVLFDVCAHQEDRYLLPALAAAGVDLDGLLGDAPTVGTAAEVQR